MGVSVRASLSVPMPMAGRIPTILGLPIVRRDEHLLTIRSFFQVEHDPRGKDGRADVGECGVDRLESRFGVL